MNKMEKSHSVQSVTRFDKYEPSRFQNVTSRIINSLTFGVNLKNPDDRFSHYPKNNFQESYSPKFTTSPFKFSPDVEATTKIEPVDEQIKDSPKPPIETIADLIDFPQNIEQSEQNELSFFDPIVSNKNFDNNMDLNYNNVYFDLNIMPNSTSHPVPQSNMDVQNLFQQVNSEYNPINSINIDSFSSIPQSQQSAHNVRSSNNILTDNSEFTSFQFAGNTVINENIEDLLDDNVNKNIMNNQHVVAQADWTSTQTSLKNSQNLDAKNFTNSLI
ncbi:hypothetical protein HZS_2932 [Henneguya salminicola]|nr:hypothetical protein HZS_2932 [Henneguya salminicola]